MRYQGPEAVTDGSDYFNIENVLSGNSSTAFIQNHVNLDNWYRFHALAEAIRHYDYWPSANKNFAWYFDDDYRPENNNLGKMWSLPWDTDASWGPTWNNGHDVVYDALFASGDAGGDPAAHPEFWPAYFSVLRELRDLLWQPDQIQPLIDHFAAKIDQFVPADLDRWLNAPADAGNYTGVAGVGKTSLAAYVQDLKNFAFVGGSWPGGDVGPGGRAAFLDQLQASSGEATQMPGTPTITYVGAANYPLDGLTFQTSAFSDPQGAGTFAAIQWRLATYTDRNSPSYDPAEDFKLEYVADWDSGPLTTFSSTQNIPPTGIEVGETYRARVRMQDTTGRWSHWSAPVEFTVTEPTSGADVRDFLRITELMYNPGDPSAAEQGAGFTDNDDFEFIELQNVSTTSTLNLAGVHFANGIEFDFTGSAVTSLGPGQRVLVVKSTAAMTARYGAGLSIAGEFANLTALNNAGENIELADVNGVNFLDFTIDDAAPWPTTPDGGGPSLVKIDPLADPLTWNDGASWRASHLSGGSPGTDDVLPASVVGRRVFYNRSFFDGNNAAANAGDDAAIDTTKSALLPGGTAGFTNYTGYSRGINGLMVDVMNLRGAPSAADFAFRTGNNNTPASWNALGTAPSVSVRTGAGSGGSDRVTLIWPDGTIVKTWLQVTVLANANTGLAAPDVFYFGNAVGEVGNTTANAIVTAADESLIRLNFTTGFGTVPVTSQYDIDKNRFVQASDAALSRANQTTAFSALRLIAVPAGSSPLGPQEESSAASGASFDIPSIDSGLVDLLAQSRRRRR
jgi:hypothetical protein